MGEDNKPNLLAIVKEFQLSKSDAGSARIAQQTAIGALSGPNDALAAGTTAALRLTEYASPLPPPDVLAQYEAQAPGVTRDMIEEWKTGRAHSRRLDHHRLAIDYLKFLGSLALAIAGLAAIVALSWYGHALPALGLGPFEAIAGWAAVRRLPSAGGVK